MDKTTQEVIEMIQEINSGVSSMKSEHQGRLDKIEELLAFKEAAGFAHGGSDTKQKVKDRVNRDKSYQGLFGKTLSNDDWKNEDEFYMAATSGQYHPGLVKASLNEGVPSDGGYLIPTEYSRKIHDVSLENEIVLPRCAVEPMRSNTKKIPGTVIGDHSQNLYGGIVGYWTAEGGTLQETNPKFRQMTLDAKKLTILFKFSNELKEDVENFGSKISTLAANGLSWFRDRAFLKGSGAGMPLGILNSDCCIEVDPEAGQTEPLMYQNLAKMVGRIHPACFKNSVWIIHITQIPYLLSLSIPVGTGWSYYPVLQESNGIWTVLTRPVIFTEKTETLNTKGDVLLADLTQYVVGLRKEMRFETSIHMGFTTDESHGRLITRVDGQPLWNEPLTLEDGSTTAGPFVTLGDRS